MKDYKKDFNDKLEDESFCDGELISIANGYITEMQEKIVELEKDKQYFSDSLDKQVEATLKLQKDYQELEQKNHEILKNSLDIYNQFDELEEKLANADYQLEGRDLKIKELENENARLATNEKSLLAERKIIAKENTEAKNLIEELASSLSVVGECGEEECELINKAQKFINKPIF